MNNDEFNRRLEIAKGAEIYEQNCIGTALYLVGLREEDGYGNTTTAYAELRRLQPLAKPEQSCLVAFEKESILGGYFVEHLGVVVSIDPVCVTHRDGGGAPVVENEPLKDVRKHWGKTGETRFYRPISSSVQ